MPGPSTPPATSRPGSPQQRSFLGGSIFTSAPEEAGDLLAESRRRKSWWGVEKDSLLQRRPSKIEKKEKQGSDKEKSREKLAKGKKEPREGSKGEKDRAEEVDVKIEAGSERAKGEAEKGAMEYPAVEEGDPKVKVVGKAEVVGNGSLPVGKGEASKVDTADKQPKAETTKIETEDDTTGSPRDAKSLRSLDSSKSAKGSQGSTRPVKKRWSLMIARKSTPEAVPIPNKKPTVDVAGPRFETAKDPVEGEVCAGDNPSIYVDSFVSSIPSTYIYVF